MQFIPNINPECQYASHKIDTIITWLFQHNKITIKTMCPHGHVIWQGSGLSDQWITKTKVSLIVNNLIECTFGFIMGHSF